MVRFARQHAWPSPTPAEIIRRARILVIDDSDFPYLRLFREDGYNTDKWSDVEDLTKLETGSFDLVLLDLLGVGQAQSEDQGFGILKHIRAANPTQIVIAYSNSDWSVEYQPFFDEADAVLHKTKTDYYGFKRAVDDLLAERFSLGFFVNRAIGELGDYSHQLSKVDGRIQTAILSGRTEKLERFLTKNVDDAIIVDRVLTVVNIALSVAQLWTH